MSLYEKMNSTFKEAMSRYKEDNDILLPESTYIMKVKSVKVIVGKTSGKTQILIERVIVENEGDSNDTEIVGLTCKQWVHTETDFSLKDAIKIFIIHYEEEPKSAKELCDGLEALTDSNPMERVLVTHYINKTTGKPGANYDVIEALIQEQEEVPTKPEPEPEPEPEVIPVVKRKRKKRKKVVKVEEVEEIDTDIEKIHKVINFFGDILKDDEALTGWEKMEKKELISLLDCYDMSDDKEDFKTIFNDVNGYDIWVDLIERNK
jgi:hypothetical protein